MEGPFLALCLLLALANGQQQPTQEALDFVASNLHITWTVVTNTKDTSSFQVEITFENRAPPVNDFVTREFGRSQWQIRFFSIFMIEPDFLGNKGHSSAEIPDQNVKITHLQGTLFSLQNAQDNVDSYIVAPGSTRKLKLKIQNWSVAQTDVMGNWYLIHPGLQPRLINSTSGEGLEFVSQKNKVEQWKRYNFDEYNPYTPQERYNRNYIPCSSDRTKSRIIPMPVLVDIDTSGVPEYLYLNSDWKIAYHSSFRQEALYLANELNLPQSNVYSASTPLDINSSRVIELKIGSVDLPSSNAYDENSEEAYFVSINGTRQGITIVARGASGIFRGIITLLNLKNPFDGVIEGYIADAPRFDFRGLMLDIARNFHDKDEILLIMEMMARYKLNHLHLHLSDDEGWRLEIPGLEDLTGIGAKRCHDDEEAECLQPQLGSGPDTSLPFSSGFLSTQDYQDILQKAKQFHIQVIPEIDMPGHARAAIKAMERRNRLLVEANQAEEGKRYRLVEENDPSDYFSVQMFNDNAINPCLDSTYNFIEKVLDELIKLHSNHQPLTLFHFGGDEVGRGAWVNSTTCKAIKDQLPDGSPKAYFFKKVTSLAKTKGINLGAWEDGLMENGNTPFSNSNEDAHLTYAFAWDNVWEWNTTARTYLLANNDYKVVMTHGSHLYFDHPYEPDPEERGYYWATRFADTKKTFSYNANDVYANIKDRRSGQNVTDDEKCGDFGEMCPSLTKPDNIVGMEAAVFSETTRTKEQLHDRLFPRLLAMAERAWHQASWETVTDKKKRENMMKEDWYSFARAVGHTELPKLEKAQINYRIPPPGAQIYRNYMSSTSLYPGLKTEYSLDAGNSWQEASSKVDLSDYNYRIWLRTRSLNGDRYSRTVILNPDAYIPPATQNIVDYIADNVVVTFTVEDNFKTYGDDYYKVRVTLANNGAMEITVGNWEIYFVSVQWIEPDTLKLGKRYIDRASQMYVQHVKGYLFKMGPTSEFQGLPASQELSITYRGRSWSSSRTDQMPNWYVTADGMTAKNIRSTADESLAFVSDINTADKWKRMKNDAYDPWTPGSRYDRNKIVQGPTSNTPPVLPTPVNYAPGQGLVDLMDGTWTIMYDANRTLSNVANYLKDTLTTFIPDIKLKSLAVTQQRTDKQTIRLTYGDVNSNSKSDEVYRLTVDSTKNIINVVAPSQKGIFYGAVSLIQLVMASDQVGKVPTVEITDWPRFPYRGMHVDTARNFQPKGTILKLLDVMGLYKLNKLHLHLTDDEGWRLEIPGIPELTTIGSKRCHDPDEQECIMSTLGSGADSTSIVNGFYSVKDYQDILRHAKERNIEVIPEFDFPGHAHAAIKAMKAKQQKDIDLGKGASSLSLQEPFDPSPYFSVQFYDDNAISPVGADTRIFMRQLFEAVKMIHEPVQPLRIFHFGGDEVAKGAWLKTEECESMNLKEHFTEIMSNLTDDLILGAWEDGMMDHNNVPWNSTVLSNKEIIVQAWQNVWEWGAGKRAYTLANAGYKVVLSPVTHTYFDHPQEPSPEERGFYWGTRFIDTFKTLSFLPDDYYRNIAIRVSGHPITKQEVCGEDNAGCPPLQRPENIIGLQGQLWSETVRSPSQFDYMVYPRLLALAEKAWYKGSWEDMTGKSHTEGLHSHWSQFAHKLGSSHLDILDKLGVGYRVPPPGARQSKNKITANVEYPGLIVQYEQGQSWKTLTPDTSFNPPIKVRLRTASADGTRFSRQIAVNMKKIKDDEGNGCSVFGLSTMLCVIITIIHSLLNKGHFV